MIVKAGVKSMNFFTWTEEKFKHTRAGTEKQPHKKGRGRRGWEGK